MQIPSFTMSSTSSETRTKGGSGRSRQGRRYGGEAKTEYKSKVVGLEDSTFDVGDPKYAAKFHKSVEEIGLHYSVSTRTQRLL